MSSSTSSPATPSRDSPQLSDVAVGQDDLRLVEEHVRLEAEVHEGELDAKAQVLPEQRQRQGEPVVHLARTTRRRYQRDVQAGEGGEV